MTTITYLLALAVVLGLAITGQPGALLAAGVVLVGVVLIHSLITSPDNPKAQP